MSKLIVEVCTIDAVHPHTNADALELCIVKGWQCVAQKGLRKAGEKIVYVPVDTVMSAALSDSLNITKYLSNGRVRCAKLRGEPSFGVIMDCADPDWPVGLDVAAHYGLTKYIPPMKITAGDAEVAHPLLQKYTEIENLRNFPNVFEPGEMVVLTEKIHGSNCKVGMVEGVWMAGSMGVRRKRPDESQLVSNIYWHAYTIEGIRRFVESQSQSHQQVLVYGEAYGKIQSLNYGERGRLSFAAFDILIDGRYLGYNEFVAACEQWGIPRVKEVARGPYSLEFVREHATGKTLYPADHVREGVVVRPLAGERIDPKLGRVVLKYINDDYLLKKEEGKVTDMEDV